MEGATDQCRSPTLQEAVSLLQDKETRNMLQNDDTEKFIEIRRAHSNGNEENSVIPVQNIKQDGSKSAGTPKAIDGTLSSSVSKITIPALDLASASKHTPPISKRPDDEKREATMVVKQVVQNPDGEAKSIMDSEFELLVNKKRPRAKKTKVNGASNNEKPEAKKQKTEESVKEQDNSILGNIDGTDTFIAHTHKPRRPRRSAPAITTSKKAKSPMGKKKGGRGRLALA